MSEDVCLQSSNNAYGAETCLVEIPAHSSIWGVAATLVGWAITGLGYAYVNRNRK